MKNLETVDGVTEGEGEQEAVAEAESEGADNAGLDNNEVDEEITKKKDKPAVMVSSGGAKSNGHVISEENDATDKSVDKTVDLVSSEGDHLQPALNGDNNVEDIKTNGKTNSDGHNEEEINKNEDNEGSSDKANGNDHVSEEETSVVNGDMETVDPSSDFELSETDKEDKEDSVPTEDFVTPGDKEEDSLMTSNDDQDKSELMDVAESPADTSTETLPLAKEGSSDSEARPSEKEEEVSDESDDVKKISDDNTGKESSEETKEAEQSEGSVSQPNENELSKVTQNGESKEHDSDSNSKDSSTENSRDSCKILMCSFVDQSPAKVSSKDSAEKEQPSVSEPEPSEEVNNTISLDPASTDDDSQSQESGDEDLDINAGLEKCFSALEKKIDSEEDTSVDDSTEKADKKDDESKVEDSSSIDIPIHDVDDDDDIMAVDEEDQSKDTSLSDPDKALEELEKIEKTTRKIFDDEDSGKRSATTDPTSEPASKKARVEESSEEADNSVQIPGTEEKKIKKIVRKMTRKQLEDMMMTKMTELITNKSEVGQLRKEVDSYKARTEKWQSRAQALSKQLTDLGTVMKKYITDTKTRPRDKVAPVKITRSVGLQVMTQEQKRLQQQRQMAGAGARIATKPAQAVLIRNSAASPAVPTGQVRITPVKASPNNNGLVKTPTVVNGLVRKTVPAVNTPSPRQSPAPQARAAVPASQLSPQQLAAVRAAVSGGQVTVTAPTKAATQVINKPTPANKKIECVNLSDDEDSPAPVKMTQVRPVHGQVPAQQVRARPHNGVTTVRPSAFVARTNGLGIRTHPAALPPMPQRQPSRPGWKLMPAKPSLKINRKGAGIVLSWNLAFTQTHATIVTYQLYAYQESGAQVPDTSLWKKVGDVKALPLPMACTLTQFQAGNKYHFAVRANDCHNRLGPFSDPQNITLN